MGSGKRVESEKCLKRVYCYVYCYAHFFCNYFVSSVSICLMRTAPKAFLILRKSLSVKAVNDTIICCPVFTMVISSM